MNDYHFVTHWKFIACCEEVYKILEDVENLSIWWPSVYLDVRIIHCGSVDDNGKVVELLTKGWLPYLLRWKFKVIESNYPHGFTIEAFGDFVGTGIWSIDPSTDAGYCNVIYDWNIQAEKPLLRKFSWLFKPLFAANHKWAMKKGEENLKLEILRRKNKIKVPLPECPTFLHNVLKLKLVG
ncbi:MAG: polyketide cyclase [Saprospiraceae bacterium]